MLGHLPHLYLQVWHGLRWWEPGLFALLVFWVPTILLWPFNKFDWYSDCEAILLYHSCIAFPLLYFMYFSLTTPWLEDFEIIMVGLYLIGGILAGLMVLLILLLELEQKVFQPPWEKEKKQKAKLEDESVVDRRTRMHAIQGGLRKLGFQVERNTRRNTKQ